MCVFHYFLPDCYSFLLFYFLRKYPVISFQGSQACIHPIPCSFFKKFIHLLCKALSLSFRVKSLAISQFGFTKAIRLHLESKGFSS